LNLIQFLGELNLYRDITKSIGCIQLIYLPQIKINKLKILICFIS
jgi:hypothetical protein